MDDHQFKEEEKGSVLKCPFLARIGRPDILWSVNKLDRSVTKWTKACNKRLARLISCIHHTCEYWQYCYVTNTAQQRRLGLFQDSDFAGDLEDSKSTSRRVLCIFRSHTFLPISLMCWCARKQTSVSHSSTEGEIILLTQAYGWTVSQLWIFGIWWWKCFIATKTNRVMSSTRRKNQTKAPTKHDSSELFHMDNVPSNVKFSQSIAMLYVVEDKEAVIKMTIKGRSPHNETCVKNPRSCAWLVIRQNQFGSWDSNQVHWHQTSIRRHFDQS